MRILVVEDERRLADTIADLLVTNNYIADVDYDGNSGLDDALSGIYDAVILDIMLPGRDGFSIVQEMRREGLNTPVMMLTARTQVDDRIRGLDSGADYYLTKPFDINELLACLRTILRRQAETVVESLSYGDISLDFSTRELCCGEKRMRLSSKEFEIMQVLVQNGQHIVSKETLLLKAWGYDSEAEDNHVEVYISFLRKKLGLIKSKVTIETVRRVGYHLEWEQESNA
ncbi:MAG: response regulator transcription factor [Oscillospiraceae bacterium]|nr:response regulator transcription factor [Oscillospiraceae bacterium]MCD8067046.1 response regulator transcription factor [Oscillospiraceae bacterium]MCD8099460.1 response regulator transcription factor [Oscillospiraceae bacterium]